MRGEMNRIIKIEFQLIDSKHLLVKLLLELVDLTERQSIKPHLHRLVKAEQRNHQNERHSEIEANRSKRLFASS
jgi:hypothetical protein